MLSLLLSAVLGFSGCGQSPSAPSEDQNLRLARELARILDPEAPGLAPFRASVEQADGTGALEAFKRFILEKHRASGLTAWRTYGPDNPETAAPWVAAAADPKLRDQLLLQASELMEGRTVNTGSLSMNISEKNRIENLVGEPGRVDWKAAGTYQGWNPWPWHLRTFTPLLAAHVLTGESRYMDRWIGYANDWASHQVYGMNTLTAETVPDQVHNAEAYFIEYVKLLATLPPAMAEAVPADVIARCYWKLATEYLPAGLAYMLGTPQNWTVEQAPRFVLVGLYFDELRAAPVMVDQGRRMFESWETIHNHSDGSENQRDSWYNNMFRKQALELPTKAAAATGNKRPGWLTPEWENHLREEALVRSRFMTRHMTTTGEDPVGHRADTRYRAKRFADLAAELPELLQDPELLRIIAAHERVTGIPILPAKIERPPGDPGFRSEWWPYAGFAFLRSGWARGDAWLYMIASPRPGKDFRSRTDNNFISLHAFGHDLLVTTADGPYTPNPSPIQVDGLNQHFHADIPQWEHRGYMVGTVNEPAPWRRFSSPAFDFIEGCYDGPFVKEPLWEKGPPGTDRIPNLAYRQKIAAQASQNAIRDTSHQRWVTALPGKNIWIVVDRVRSENARSFQQNWPVFTPTGVTKVGFAPASMNLAPELGEFLIQDPGKPRFAWKQFASVPLTYAISDSTHKNLKGETQGFRTILSKWQSKGDAVVITVLRAWPEGTEDPVVSWTNSSDKAQAALGATLRNGETLRVAASKSGPRDLGGGVRAESVVEWSGSGKREGLVLGSQGTPADYGYEEPGGLRRPILQPIRPVSFSPGIASFSSSVDVTLACTTPGVEIRYTLDGSDPGPDSPVYDSPLRITETTTVKARALRPGLTELPGVQDGLLATAVFQARFERVAMTPSLEPPKPLQPGLRFNSLTGSWQDALLHPGRLEPAASGIARSVPDPGAALPSSPHLTRYEGWLTVPEDGDYTFHLPPEIAETTRLAGFLVELKMHNRPWFPETRRHAYGTWTTSLARGSHPIVVEIRDYRSPGVAAQINTEGIADIVFEGAVPPLKFSRNGKTPAPIPPEWLGH